MYLSPLSTIIANIIWINYTTNGFGLVVWEPEGNKFKYIIMIRSEKSRACR